MRGFVHPLRTLWRCKFLLVSFIKREIKERIAGSFLGPLNFFLQPLLHLLLFVFLFKFVFKIRIQLSSSGDEFLPYFLSGFIPWSLHNEALLRASHAVIIHGYLLTKVAFPAEILPLSSVLAIYALGLVGILILLAFFLFTKGVSFFFLLLPVALLLQLVFSLGVVLFLAALLVYLRDLQQFLGLFTMVWFYASPILYTPEMLPDLLKPVVFLNPFTYFLDLWRAVYALLPFSLSNLALCFLLASASLLLGYAFFQKCKEGFADML